MKKLLFFAFLHLLKAQTSQEFKAYKSFRNHLAEHCSSKYFRGSYDSRVQKESVVIDWSCSRGLAAHWKLALPFSFVSNLSEAWVLYPAMNIQFDSSSKDLAKAHNFVLVEHYKNPDARWSNLWLSTFEPLEVVSPRDKKAAELLLNDYEINYSTEKKTERFHLKSKNSKLPSFALTFTPEHTLPASIEIEATTLQIKEELRLKREKEIQNPSNRSFAPDVSRSFSTREY